MGRGCNGPEAIIKLKAGAKRCSLDKWQNRWSKNTGCRTWTKHLLFDVWVWTHKHSDKGVTFHLAQTHTGHSCFQAYMYGKKKPATLDAPIILRCQITWTYCFCLPHFGFETFERTQLHGRRSSQVGVCPFMCRISYGIVQNKHLGVYLETWEKSTRNVFFSIVEGILEEQRRTIDGGKLRYGRCRR